MSHIRVQSLHMQEGDGAEVNRLFPLPGRLMNHDPFVLWDEFTIRPGAGFPTHPHRGFEAITYLFAGHMQHSDNLGNHSTIGSGGAQRFTAGKGISHSEMPGGQEEAHGIQLWINLPRRMKGMEPSYQEVAAEDIPQQGIPGGHERIIVGPGSPLRLHTEISYREFRLKRDASYSATMPATHRGLVYLLSGAAKLGDTVLQPGDAGFLETGAAWRLDCRTDCHFMLCTGVPHGEAIRQHGSFVD